LNKEDVKFIVMLALTILGLLVGFAALIVAVVAVVLAIH